MSIPRLINTNFTHSRPRSIAQKYFLSACKRFVTYLDMRQARVGGLLLHTSMCARRVWAGYGRQVAVALSVLSPAVVVKQILLVRDFDLFTEGGLKNFFCFSCFSLFFLTSPLWLRMTPRGMRMWNVRWGLSGLCGRWRPRGVGTICCVCFVNFVVALLSLPQLEISLVINLLTYLVPYALFVLQSYQ
jgi:hypothetical protein